jgi:hypothetical protein
VRYRGEVPDTLGSRPFSWAQGLQVQSAAQLRGGAYQRLGRGAYWIAGGAVDVGRRIEAVRAVLPTDAVLGGLSAAWALGSPWSWDLPGRPQPIEMILPHARRVRSRPGLVVRGDAPPAEQIVRTRYGWATGPARTAYDLARRSRPGQRDVAETVARVDAVLHACRIDVDAVRTLITPGARGCRIAGRILDLAEPAAESPQESRLRVSIVLAGLPVPVVQFELIDEWGRVVYRLDLAWPALRRAVEYDGLQHRLDDAQYLHDIDRYNRLAAQWQVMRVIAPHMRTMPALITRIGGFLAAPSPRATLS